MPDSVNRPTRGAHGREAAPLTSSAWRQVRRTLTAGLFVAATVAGVAVGLNGASVSPVAPAPAVTAAAAGPEQAGGIDLGAGTNPAPGLDRGPGVDGGAGLDRGAGFNHGPHR
jgi:hypothetical protein